MFFVLSKYHHLFFNPPTFLGQFRPSHGELGPDWEWSAVRNLRGATQRGPAANSRRWWGRIRHLSLAGLHQAGGGEGGKVSTHARTIHLWSDHAYANYSSRIKALLRQLFNFPLKIIAWTFQFYHLWSERAARTIQLGSESACTNYSISLIDLSWHAWTIQLGSERACANYSFMIHHACANYSIRIRACMRELFIYDPITHALTIQLGSERSCTNYLFMIRSHIRELIIYDPITHAQTIQLGSEHACVNYSFMIGVGMC